MCADENSLAPPGSRVSGKPDVGFAGVNLPQFNELFLIRAAAKN